MVYKFTKSGEKVLEIASELATDLGHTYIGTEHILYGLACEENGVAGKVLANQNVVPEDILDKIEEIIGAQIKENFTVLGFTPRTKRVLENAYMEAKKLGSNFIGTEHILVGIIKENDSLANKILFDLNINSDNIYSSIVLYISILNVICNVTGGELGNVRLVRDSDYKEKNVIGDFTRILIMLSPIITIIALPIFLAHGIHTKLDIPTALGLNPQPIENYPVSNVSTSDVVEFDGEIIYLEPLGADDKIVEIIQNRVNKYL